MLVVCCCWLDVTIAIVLGVLTEASARSLPVVDLFLELVIVLPDQLNGRLLSLLLGLFFASELLLELSLLFLKFLYFCFLLPYIRSIVTFLRLLYLFL